MAIMDAPLKIMPHSVEAEQSVLGSMIIDKVAIGEAIEVLKADDFYRDTHKTIYEAIVDLYQKDSAVDIITLSEKLKANNQLDLVGGITYVTELSGSVITTSNVSSYIGIVKDKSTLRKLIRASNEIIDNSYNNQGSVEDVVGIAEKQIFDIASNRETSDFEPMSAVLERGFNEIEKLFINKGQTTGVSSGFHDLDAKTSGFQKGDMVLIAARPSMGKTTFALNIAENAALRSGKRVAIFSLEMSKEQLAYKLLCSEAHVDMLKLR
ncbi:MAG: replicative helicase, partial [Firmicutes bacterium]|nr:replicative helicase [Bacillota bacterium]